MAKKEHKYKYNIYTLDGDEILQDYTYKRSLALEKVVITTVDEDIIKSTDSYNRNALFFQITSYLEKTEGIDIYDTDCLSDKLVYLDFKEAMKSLSEDAFYEIMLDGLNLEFCDTYIDENGEIKTHKNGVVKFVPFEKSNSQAKACVMSFIREDLFAPMREIVDLGLDLEQQHKGTKLANLSKLYAYRGLYLTDAKFIANSHNEHFTDFFSEENIVIIDDIVIDHSKEKVNVYTAQQNEGYRLSPINTLMSVKLNCFDGEGIISPAAAKLINVMMNPTAEFNPEDKFDPEKDDSSFQVRMPFFKGMLHCVDFQAFLDEMKLDKDEVIIIDAFKKERNLRKANIVATTSMLKLCSLNFEKILPENCDPMKEYFDRVKKYNHGLYLAKSESNLHNNGFTHLTYQYLNTLKLSADTFDDIANEHIKRADLYSPKNVFNTENNPDSLKDLWQDDCMKLLKKQPLFIYDKHIENQMRDLRVSKYKELAFGRISVNGEMRFLSGDLLYFLYHLVNKADQISEESKEAITGVKNKCNKKEAVYLPGNVNEGERVAVLRSPHLSRNEDVSARVFVSNEYYKKYLSHLKGVIMIGYDSYMANALGGADFDGDTVNIVYDERIVNASLGGYAEGESNSLPFINIEPLKSEHDSTEKPIGYKYSHPKVLLNTFNSRIGYISNAAVRIAAVEYNPEQTLDGNISAALCTILTGNEIDAAKKGVRPYIDDVLNFCGNNDSQEKIVKEVKQYIKCIDILENFKARVPKVSLSKDAITLNDDEFSSIGKLYPNRELTIPCQLLYRWAELFVDFEDSEIKLKAPERKKYLSKVWNCDFKCSTKTAKSIKDILSAYKSTVANYGWLKKTKYKCENNSDNIARIKSILKEQYDNIYSSELGTSVNAKYINLQHSLSHLCGEDGILSGEELTALCQRWFSQNSDDFDCTAYWPFFSEKERNQLDEVFKNSLPFTQIVKNFDSKGYALLYYILKNVQSPLHFSEVVQKKEVKNKDNEYAVLFNNKKVQDLKKNVLASKFEKDLAKEAKNQIFELFSDDTDPQNIIMSIYLLNLSDQQREAFWRIFSVSDVLAVLEGRYNVK